MDLVTTPAAGWSLAADFAFVFGLSFFLGLAYEDVFLRAGIRRPGGVRTFPLLALLGALLLLLDPRWLIPFTVGLFFVGACMVAYYWQHLQERDESGQRNVGLIVIVLNVFAYVLGAVVVAFPYWIAVGATVTATLLFTGRSRLHAFAQRVELGEIVTAAEFLILAGLILPLLPAVPVTPLTSITPRGAWLALVVVCGLSYASYLVQRYAVRFSGGLWMAALGGLYSSTATTVVLARRTRDDPATLRQSQAGIVLATGVMYLRILVVITVFDAALARAIVAPLLGLAAAALLAAGWWYRRLPQPAAALKPAQSGNPLELGPAVAFALAFVAVALLSSFVESRFGISGIYALAAVVGVSDIDPFVLSLAQGGVPGLPLAALGGAVLIAASSNNVLKACYSIAFGGLRAGLFSVIALAVLALAGVGIAGLAFVR
ncbi:MAG: DUF4010 domain-containing protein [Candidatus Lustribacter sp.]|jgi:uncharacterized membrane protein (DUF4010 family)